MQLESTTGADIVLAGLTISHSGPTTLPWDHYLADEERRARINSLVLEGDVTQFFDADDPDDVVFPALTAGELEDAAVSVKSGARIFLKVTIPGTLTVADGLDSVVVPFQSKIIGIAAYCNTDPTGAAVIVGLKKNGADVFTGHTADRLQVADGANKGVVGPAFGGAAFNAGNAAGLQCSAGDVLIPTVTQIGTGSSHHGADLSVLIALEANDAADLND